MHKWIQILMAVLTLSAALPSSATIITGADGPLAPAADTTLPYRADGIFDFSSIDIGAGITLRFDAGMQNVTLLSLGDILIAGVIDATGVNLALETRGTLVLTGSIMASSINLATGRGGLTPPDTLQLQPGGNLTIGAPRGIPPLIGAPPGGELIIRSPGDIVLARGPQPGAGILLAVPEPGTAWLMALLPMLALFGRKRS